MFDQNLKHYLLGILSDEEIEKIDLEIISNEDLEEKLLIAEHDVIEEYLEETLTEKEIEGFHNNFLISPEREKMVAEIAGLKRFARKAIGKNKISDSMNDSKKGFILKLRGLLGLTPARAGFTLLILGICSAIIIFAVFSNSGDKNLTTLEIEYAKLNQNDFSDLEKYKKFSQLNLMSSSTRSFDPNSKKIEENITDKIFLRLALPANIGFERVFDIEVEQDGENIFTQTKLRQYKNPNGEELRILLPKSIFKTGEYLVKAKNDKNSVIVYSFSVK